MFKRSIVKFLLNTMLVSSLCVIDVFASGPVTLEKGAQELALEISNQMKAKKLKKIAIDGFADLNGNKSAVSDFISEELVTNFYSYADGSFDVVERRELARVIKEQKLGTSGLLDRETIAKIGQILGIDAIVTGSIAYLGDNLKVNARMIGVNDAKVFAAASKKMVKDETVLALLGQSARSGDTGAGTQTQSFQTKFENRFLLARPVSVSRRKEGKGFAVALELQNKLNEPVYLSAVWSNNSFARITGNKGAAISGYDAVVTGLPYVSASYLKNNMPEKRTVIDANSKTTILFNFTSRAALEDDFINFSLNMARQHQSKENSFSQFTIGIANIKVN